MPVVVVANSLATSSILDESLSPNVVLFIESVPSFELVVIPISVRESTSDEAAETVLITISFNLLTTSLAVASPNKGPPVLVVLFHVDLEAIKLSTSLYAVTKPSIFFFIYSLSFLTATVTELVDSFFRVMVKPVITSDTTFELLVMSMPFILSLASWADWSVVKALLVKFTVLPVPSRVVPESMLMALVLPLSSP